MQFVVDANILIAAFLKSAVTRQLLTDDKIKLFAPEYFVLEIEQKIKSNALLRKRIKLDNDEIEELLDFLFKHITVLPKEEYAPFLEEAEKISPLDDAPYIALSLAMRIPLWSNDALLKKQDAVIVYSTSELIKLLA
jgi:predicted nucleic acid-binding protein